MPTVIAFIMMPVCLQLCQLALLVSQDQKHPHSQVVALHSLGSASLLFALQPHT